MFPLILAKDKIAELEQKRQNVQQRQWEILQKTLQPQEINNK